MLLRNGFDLYLKYFWTGFTGLLGFSFSPKAIGFPGFLLESLEKKD
jgi:hypothetical protein